MRYLVNGCIPYFQCIIDSPKATMVNFPKVIISETNKLYEIGGVPITVISILC